MKKKILYGAAVFVLAAMAAWNVNFSSQTKGMSDVSLANVEALAREISAWGCAEAGCHIQFNYTCHVYQNIGGYYFWVGSCDMMWGL